MPVVQHRIQEVLCIYRIPPDLLNAWRLPFGKDDTVVEFVALLNADVFLDDVVDVVVRIENLDFDVEKTGLAFDPYKIARLLIVQLAIDVDLHV